MSYERLVYSSDAPFWLRVDADATLVPINAADLLEAIEAGSLPIHAEVQVSPLARPLPVRRLLRELVWMAYSEGGVPSPAEKEIEAPFRTAFDRAPIAMVLADLGGRITDANQACAALLGRSPESLIDQPISSIGADADRSAELALGAEMFAGRRAAFTIEKRFLHADGTAIPTLLSVALVRRADGQPERVVASALDLRERNELEARRRQEHAITAVQAIANGVAHDLSNLLHVIQASAGLLEERHGGGIEELQALDSAVKVAATLTQQLRHLARPPSPSPTRMELDRQLDRLAPMLRRLLPEGVRLVILVSGAPEIRAEIVDLEQILLNLVINAGQHSKPGGAVRVRANVEEGGAVLSVEDDGSGMSEEVQRRSIEPYFSARVGGTGLGLAVVQAAAQRAGASLHLHSRLGVGTIFTLRFPSLGENKA